MSNDEYRDVLETNRLEIVKSINCERSRLLDYLRSKQIFDQEDTELIRSATTNDARVGKLIDFLLRKGPDAYKYFLHVVQIDCPMLYETLTGEKATNNSNPLMRQFAFPELKPGEFSQLQPLAEYQERMLKDLQDGAKRFREVLKANETLEKKLENTAKDLELEKERTKHYENRLTQEMHIDESLQKSEVMLYYEYDEMEKGIADRDVYIIVLQMKLLAEKEEVEKLKSMVEDLEHKNGDMARELRRVSQSYNQERCQSLKLSECIRIQGDEIQKINDLRKQVRECKYKTIIVTEERDTKIQELTELKKWTEALKTRFDVIEREKQNSMEKTEVVSSNCVFLQETVRTLSSKLSSSQLQLEELRKRNELLTKDCELFKTQRNYALEARKEAVNSREKVISEKDSIQAQCNDLLAKHEQMNEERQNILQTCDSLHLRYRCTSEDLTRVKTALNEKELEVEDLVRKLREANDKNHRNSVLLETLPGMSDNSDEDNEPAGSLAAEQLKNETADEETDFRRPWRERRMKSLLSSIKFRIAGDRASAEGTLTREHVGIVAGNVTMDVLQHLLPNLISTRPCSIDPLEHTTSPKNSRTLQRHKCLRQKKIDRSTIETHKPRSQTAPCLMMKNAPDIFAKLDESSTGVRSSNSTPDLNYDDIPKHFRNRSKQMTINFRRTKSTE